jgi:hypothetical protein
MQSSSYANYQSNGFDAAGYNAVSSSARGYNTDVGDSLIASASQDTARTNYDVAGNQGVTGFSANSYGSSASYGTSANDEGIESSFASLNVGNAGNDVAGGTRTYQSYSSEQTYSQ